ncbi:MAG: hypothetical protein ABIJ05_00550, partial [Patescibacteria group bacterium]
FLTLRSTNKSNSTIKIRDNVNYFLSTIQRQLRGAQAIVNCPNSDDTSIIEYIDEDGNSGSFSCATSDDLGYIASGSARLNTEEIDITSCSFECVEGTSGNPPSVIVTIVAEDSSSNLVEKGRFSSTTKIYLRNN